VTSVNWGTGDCVEKRCITKHSKHRPKGEDSNLGNTKRKSKKKKQTRTYLKRQQQKGTEADTLLQKVVWERQINDWWGGQQSAGGETKKSHWLNQKKKNRSTRTQGTMTKRPQRTNTGEGGKFKWGSANSPEDKVS